MTSWRRGVVLPQLLSGVALGVLMLGLFVLTGSLFLLLQINLMAVTVALVLLHFYLDGIFWAFRRPEVRKVLGPYLTGWRAPAAAAAQPQDASAARAG